MAFPGSIQENTKNGGQSSVTGRGKNFWGILSLLVLLVGLGVAADFVKFFYKQPITQETRTVIIKPGQGFKAILATLEPQLSVKHLLYWLAYATLTGAGQRVMAGEYQLETGIARSATLQKLLAGGVRLHKFVLIPGKTYAQIVDTMQEAKKSLVPGDLRTTRIASLLNIQKDSLEGMFLPDTYFFVKGAKGLDVLRLAHEKMQSVLSREWEHRDEGLPLKNAYEALIMASIIEKEALFDSERELIAGVFVKRLEIGMRLQADPTVIYGLGRNFKGKLRRSQLRKKTPYNTYRIYGLPPTPIASPSLASIKAALHPAKNDYLYFVVKGGGKHSFSKTYKEHRKSVNAYRK